MRGFLSAPTDQIPLKERFDLPTTLGTTIAYTLHWLLSPLQCHRSTPEVRMNILKTFSVSVLGLSFFHGCHLPQSHNEDIHAGPVIEGEFIVPFRLSQQEKSQLGLTELKWNEDMQAGLYFSNNGTSAQSLRRALNQHREAGRIEPNRPAKLQSFNDPLLKRQWNFTLLQMDRVWSQSTGHGVTVAVLDTGVSPHGEDTPVNLINGYDFHSEDNDSTDYDGHGTHVAGTIAQASNNGRGTAGMAPDATILAVRVLGNGGSTYDIAQGIRYAVNQGADVINMSLTAGNTDSMRRALDYAHDNDVVVVAASGNEGQSYVGFPANYDTVLGVGAALYDKTDTSYSNGGTGLDVVAPGGSGYDQNGDGYQDGILQEAVWGTSRNYLYFQGTSMASPHVAGLAALLISAGADPADVPDLIRDTAQDQKEAGWDTYTGYGFIDPLAALAAIEGSTEPPDEEIEEPPPEEDPDGEEPDTDAPLIENLVHIRDGTHFEVRWTTNEPATTEIVFTNYGRYGDPTTLSTDHVLTYTVGEGYDYEFYLSSKDDDGNEGTSDLIVSTDTGDTTAPEISDIEVVRDGSDLSVRWSTDESGTTQIYFESYGLYGHNTVTGTEHHLEYTVSATASYTFYLQSTDEDGNTSKSDWITSEGN